jgi:hypothetical protein
MAFFDSLAAALKDVVSSVYPTVSAIALKKADGTIDFLKSDDNGSAMVNLAAGEGIATDASVLAVSAQLPASLGAKAKTASFSVALATDSLLAPPTKPTAITASDETDLTALASIGVTIGVGGNLAFRMVGAPSTTITLAVYAGQFVYGQFTRVMAATTATGIVGWAP